MDYRFLEDLICESHFSNFKQHLNLLAIRPYSIPTKIFPKGIQTRTICKEHQIFVSYINRNTLIAGQQKFHNSKCLN